MTHNPPKWVERRRAIASQDGTSWWWTSDVVMAPVSHSRDLGARGEGPGCATMPGLAREGARPEPGTFTAGGLVGSAGRRLVVHPPQVPEPCAHQDQSDRAGHEQDDGSDSGDRSDRPPRVGRQQEAAEGLTLEQGVALGGDL